MRFNIDVKNRKRLDEIGRDFLELFAVNGFALAQPIYSLMSKNTEFFTAHHLFKLDFLNLVLTLGLAIPLAIVAVELVIGLLLGFLARKVVHIGVLFIGLWLVFMPVMDNVFSHNIKRPMAASILCAGAMIYFYLQSPALRSYLRLLAFGAVLFPLHFLFLTPIRRVFFSRTKFPQVAFVPEKKPHVFFMVFDEFNSTALLNEKQEIDAVRYPNFAALAGDGMWFPRASSVSSATILAVPAALTGLQPSEKRRVPGISDHPNNLFTMLAHQYRMNVIEPYTSLFPPLLPNTTWTPEPTLERYKASMADLAVVYQHITYPKPLRQHLPSITHTFRGFASGSHTDADDVKMKSGSAYDRDQRRKQMQLFIKNIRNSPEPSLNFLHVLLPHHFHDYLHSGQFYCPAQLMDGRLLPANAWNNNQDLADLSYQRYLLQVGFVDRMLGEVIAKIKAEGMYDNSVIVLIGDHGISFRAGQPVRPLSNVNYPDILSVPIIIKLPHQKVGRKDPRFVESTDVVPTVLEAIGALIDGKLDGQSLISGELPPREMKHVFDLDTKTWKDYSFREITSYPMLRRAIESFGSGTPLDDLRRTTPYEEIMGKPLQELNPKSAPEFLPDVREWALFRDEIDLDASYLPLYISGSVKAPASLKPPFDIAVCLNGKVSSVARTYVTESYENAFKTLLPKSALRKGKNELSVALLRRGADSEIEALVNDRTTSSPFTLCDADTAQPYLRTAENEKIQIAQGIVDGALEPFPPKSDMVLALGWAVCPSLKQPAQKIVLFADNEYLATIPVNIERPDIQQWLGQEYLKSGINMELPVLPMLGCEIRAYALAGNGWASELDSYRMPGSNVFERFCFYGAAKLETDSQERPVIVLSNGRRLESRSGKYRGKMEKVDSSGENVRVVGWAANAESAALPKAILIFHRDRLVAARRPNTIRTDIALEMNLKNMTKCGFDCQISKKDFIAAGDTVGYGNIGKAMQAYAVFHDGAICELKGTP